MTKPVQFKFKLGDDSATISAVNLYQARNLLAHALRGQKIESSFDMASEMSKKYVLVNADKLFLGMSEADFRRFDEACQRVYTSLAGDWREAGVKSMSRRDLIETVIDGGSLRSVGEYAMGRRNQWEQFYDSRVAPWVKQHFGTPAFYRTMKLIFPEARYGT